MRSWGQSNLVKASILMPACGYLLLLNDEVQQRLAKIKFDRGWLLAWLLDHIHLPPTWRIWLLFYGSFSLAAGSILFGWRCPEEIKRYSSSFEMANAESRLVASQRQTGRLRSDVQSLYAQLSRWEDSILTFRVDFGEHVTLQGQPSSDTESSLLITQWELKNIKCPLFRICVLLIFWTGLILVAIPAVITFINVSEVAFQRLLGFQSR